jgi:hypothetical protein
MIGTTEKEGVQKLYNLLPGRSNPQIFKDFVDNFYDYAPSIYGLKDHTKDTKAVLRKLERFYGFENFTEFATDEILEKLVDSVGDSTQNFGIYWTAMLASMHTNTFYYLFTYPGDHTYANLKDDMTVERPTTKLLRFFHRNVQNTFTQPLPSF